MKQNVGVTDISRLLRRFYEFTDSVLRSISIRFDDDGTQRMDISISVRDAEAIDKHSWVCVVLFVDCISEMSVRDRPRTTIQVISDGIHIAMYDKQIGMEFGGAFEEPKNIEELRDSDVYVLGSTLSFDVFPY
jgi:hypothetical protein